MLLGFGDFGIGPDYIGFNVFVAAVLLFALVGLAMVGLLILNRGIGVLWEIRDALKGECSAYHLVQMRLPTRTPEIYRKG